MAHSAKLKSMNGCVIWKKPGYRRCVIGWSRPINLFVIALISLTGRISAKEQFYGFCFQAILEADVNGDFILEPAEYTNFAFAYTRGVAKPPLPQDLINVFMSVADTATMQLPVPGVKEGASPEEVASASKLCFTINSVIQKLLNVGISPDQCMGALGAADQTAPKGQISPEEYITVLRGLTGQPYDQVTTLDDLDILTKSVFLDMEVEGFISGGAGTEYLGEFCLRTVVAHALDNLANKLYPESAVKPIGTSTSATQSEIPPSTNASEVPSEEDSPSTDSTQAPSETADEAANAVATEAVIAEETVGTFSMTPGLLEKCRLAMLFIDKNRDNVLDMTEFGLLVDRLKTEVKGGVAYRKESDVYDAHYDVMKDALGGVPSLYGSKPTHVASTEDTETLKAICQSTYEAMEDAKDPSGGIGKGDALMKQSVASIADEEIQLEPEVLDECKRSIFVSDRDRNGGLDVDEFVFLLNRLNGADEQDAFYEFSDLHDVFHEIYKDLSSYSERTNSFSVSSLGSKPGTVATSEETFHLDSVCEAVVFALKESP